MTEPASSLTFSHGPAWPNRIALAPLTNMQSNADGTLHDDEFRWLLPRAEGGFGMVMTCGAHVNKAGQTFAGQLGSYDDAHLPGLTRLASGLRKAGAVSALQLHHGGRRANSQLSGLPVVAPWDDAERGVTALTTAQVEEVVQDFVAAAVRAEKAGFDGVEIHGGHGYLLAQFLDGRNNHRTDRFGGSLENRFRIVHEIIDGIRRATSSNMQLGLRLSAERNGIVLEEARELVGQVLADGKLDYLDLSLWDVFKEVQEGAYRGRRLIECFMDIPRHTTRVGVAGKIVDGAGVRASLDQGADFVLIGTAGILHRDFARRVIADPNYSARSQPAPAEHFVAESVGPRFLHYLATNWNNFVA